MEKINNEAIILKKRSLKGRRLPALMLFISYSKQSSVKKHSGPDAEPSATSHDDARSHRWKAEFWETAVVGVGAERRLENKAP